MVCRECGCGVPAGASRCPRCGAPVPAAGGAQGGEPVAGTISLEPGEGLEEVELVKRVVATAGQTVDIVDGAVYVDGEPLEEDYVDGALTEELAGSGIEFPCTVPEGELWVMGDNRTNSTDSRWFGSVPVESVTGRVFFCYWPWDRIGVVE